MFAPRPAASRINFSARAILASRSQLHAIWVAATVMVLIKYSARKPGPLGRGGSAARYIELSLRCSESKRRGRARAHEFALFASRISKSVRNGTLEVIGVAPGKHPGISANRQFYLTLDD